MGERKNGLLSPLKAIRAKCVDCCGGNAWEVKICNIKTCALWPYRLGKTGRARRPMTEEQRAQATARLRLARARKQAVA